MVFHTEKWISLADATLFCSQYGQGSPTLLVMHGGPGLGHDYLLPQMAVLGEFSSAIFYDQRGTGKSESGDQWQSTPFQTYVEDIEALRKSLGLKRISLLAHSWGSMLISRYAIAFPQHVDKIIYVNPVPLSSQDYLAFVKHRSDIVDGNKDQLDRIRQSQAFKQGDPDTVEKFYRIYFMSYFYYPELVNNLSLTMTPQAGIHNFNIYDLFLRYTMQHPFDLYPELKKLNKEALIIACDKDVIPFSYMEKLHENLLHSKLVLIEKCGHFPYIDQPRILFKIIREFLE